MLSLIIGLIDVTFGFLYHGSVRHPNTNQGLAVSVYVIFALILIWFAEYLPKSKKRPDYTRRLNINVNRKTYFVVGWIVLVCAIPLIITVEYLKHQPLIVFA